MSLFFAFRPFFSVEHVEHVEHVEFEMAGCSRERLMASVAYSRINGQYFFIAQKGIPVCLVCSETTSSIPSVDRLVRDMKCETSH